MYYSGENYSGPGSLGGVGPGMWNVQRGRPDPTARVWNVRVWAQSGTIMLPVVDIVLGLVGYGDTFGEGGLSLLYLLCLFICLSFPTIL